MGGVVVRLHQVLKDVDVSPLLVFREVSPHARLQRSIESFEDARLRLRVVIGEVMDAVLLQQSMNGSEVRVLDLSATSLAGLR